MFARAPELKAILGKPIAVEVQSGLSNHVLKVTTQKDTFFLRTGEIAAPSSVNRFFEAHNLHLAAKLEVAVAPLWIEPDRGILVTRAIDDVEFGHADLPVMLAKQLVRLHCSGEAFEGEINSGQVFQSYQEEIKPKIGLLSEGNWFPGIEYTLNQVATLFDCLAPTCRDRFVPSHGDPSIGNCLVSGGRLWLIDWEFSGMADPYWDLAYAIVEHQFDVLSEEVFLQTYQEGSGRIVEYTELEAMKAQCNAISAFWALSQLLRGRNPEVFSAFAQERLGRVLHHISS